MRTNIIEWIDLVNKYVNNKAFQNDRSITKFLYIMKNNTSLEWFNCARIADVVKDGEDELMVQSLQGWEKVLDASLEEEIETLSPYKIKLITPVFTYNPYEFEWELVEVYPKFIIDSITPTIIYRSTSIQNVLDKRSFKEILPFLHETWMDKSFERYLIHFPYYHEANVELKEFYKTILFLAFGKDLKVKDEYKALNMNCIKTIDPVILFKNIHECITTFHIYMNQFLKRFESSKEQLKELGYLKENLTYNGLEQIQKLERNESLFEKQEEQVQE